MVPPPKVFRLVYRSFERFQFDDDKSAEVEADRGFDLNYATEIFPGYVLERQDTRYTQEARYQAIGEIFGDVIFVVYTRRNGVCRIITAWRATAFERDLWYDYAR